MFLFQCIAWSLGRCWKPRSPASVFNTSLGTWWMLMHEKPCLIPIVFKHHKSLPYLSLSFNKFIPAFRSAKWSRTLCPGPLYHQGQNVCGWLAVLNATHFTITMNVYCRVTQWTSSSNVRFRQVWPKLASRAFSDLFVKQSAKAPRAEQIYTQYSVTSLSAT